MVHVNENARKRPSEYVDNKSLWKKMKTNSKSKNTFLESKWHQVREASEIIPRHKLHMPIRRNQKLSDKVTTLQKLVSPFGKTDTASVLHEASLYIKLLQAQIWNLFQMLSVSYISKAEAPHTQGCGHKVQVD
ncbi:transcription factor bHLH111-like [Gastrolobium bilobum]|uniref:transcription factor bHLH111-like n=1 Tax=Gastrolobium bilobum TaxID=150636 RepID=UPI002AB2913B|nr:transcription factor bHLH111-like [Gastrolobium bilobum]